MDTPLTAPIQHTPTLNFCSFFSSSHSVPVSAVAVCTWFVGDKQVMGMGSIFIKVLHYDWWRGSDSFPWISGWMKDFCQMVTFCFVHYWALGTIYTYYPTQTEQTKAEQKFQHASFSLGKFLWYKNWLQINLKVLPLSDLSFCQHSKLDI